MVCRMPTTPFQRHHNKKSLRTAAVNHKILLQKLYAYGIGDNMHALLVSYVKNHKQFTLCNAAEAQINTIQCGASQSSTLGPLLFSLYILIIINYILNLVSNYLLMTQY